MKKPKQQQSEDEKNARIRSAIDDTKKGQVEKL